MASMHILLIITATVTLFQLSMAHPNLQPMFDLLHNSVAGSDCSNSANCQPADLPVYKRDIGKWMEMWIKFKDSNRH